MALQVLSQADYQNGHPQPKQHQHKHQSTVVFLHSLDFIEDEPSTRKTKDLSLEIGKPASRLKKQVLGAFFYRQLDQRNHFFEIDQIGFNNQLTSNEGCSFVTKDTCYHQSSDFSYPAYTCVTGGER